MLANIIISELMKLKRSKMSLLVAFGGLLPSLLLLSLSWYAFNKGSGLSWTDLISNNFGLMHILLAPALFALFGGFMISREFQENTANSWLTYPTPRWKLLIGKYIVMFPMVALTFVLNFICFLFIGYFFGTEPATLEVLLMYGKLFIYSILLQYALVPISVFIALITKNIIPSMALGVGAVVSTGLVINWEHAIYFPYAIPLLISTNPLYTTQLASESLIHGVIVISTVFVLTVISSLVYFHRMDVQGSA